MSQGRHPAVVVRTAQRSVDGVRRRLGLYEWEIEVLPEFADDGAAAQTVAKQDIHHAAVRLSASWTAYPEAYRRQTVVHEVLHVAMSRLDDTVFAAQHVLSEKVWPLFEASYIAAVEPLVDRLALAIEPLLD